MWRWLSELANPTLRCKRLGHRLVTAEYIFREYPSKRFNASYDEAIYTQPECDRCGARLGMMTEESRSFYAGINMRDACWDKLKRLGRVCIDGRIRR